MQEMEASLSTLILSIGSTAMMSLGLAPDPTSGKLSKDLLLAKFNIDLLQVIEKKTKGNLSPDEESLIGQMLSDLQMKYVDAKK